MRIRALAEQYRCPDDFCEFSLGGELSSGSEYFQFGADITCYGRSVNGGEERSGGSLDLSRAAEVEHGSLSLPFDPTEIIDNLRLERYPGAAGMRSGSLDFLRKLYYSLRPHMNASTRKWIQKLHARNWEETTFPHWPVDTTVEDLCERLLMLEMQAAGVEEVPFIWFWPKMARGCVIMTHDVETEAGRDACADLMDLDDEYQIKASFQVVPEERYAVTEEFLEGIRSRGFEVGVQDLNHDGRLFDNRKEFLRRAALINRYGKEYVAAGFRAGVLYRRPEWYDAFEFSFDMSIPNVARLDPQRGGCCTVRPYFIGNILELPVTTVQDYTLFYLLNQRSTQLWEQQLDRIFQKNGLATFIAHPDYLATEDTRTVYRQLLAHLQRRRQYEGVWCALPSEVDCWWRARSQMSLRKEAGRWIVQGPSADRASVAYARLAGNRIAYEFTSSAVKAPAWAIS